MSVDKLREEEHLDFTGYADGQFQGWWEFYLQRQAAVNVYAHSHTFQEIYLLTKINPRGKLEEGTLSQRAPHVCKKARRKLSNATGRKELEQS